MKYFIVVAFVACNFILKSQPDSIVRSIGKFPAITLEEIQNLKTYVLESDNIWRMRYDSGEIYSEANFKKVFNFCCFCRTKVLHGDVYYYSQAGKLLTKKHYRRGKLIYMKHYE